MTGLEKFGEHILKLDHTAHAVHSIREAARLYMATKPVRQARSRTWMKEVSDVVTDPRKGAKI